jgi:hypothetical protein
MTNLPATVLNQAIQQTITRLQNLGIDITNIHTQVAERLENKLLETFLAMMSAEQLAKYEQSLDTGNDDAIQLISAEIATAIPEFNTTLDQVLEIEREQIIEELTKHQ